MGINRALISRLGFALTLTRLEPAQSRDYVTARLRAVGVHANPFEDQALELLIQAAGGLPLRNQSPGPTCHRGSGRHRYTNHQRDTRSSRSGPLAVAQLYRRLRQTPGSWTPTPLPPSERPHDFYRQLTGQKLTLRFDRERLGSELPLCRL